MAEQKDKQESEATGEDSPETSEPEALQVSRELVENLTDLVLDCFPVQQEKRRIGLRTAFPVCAKNGRAGDSGTLWPFLKKMGSFQEYREKNGMLSALIGEEYRFSVTTGRGMIEIEIPLCSSLQEVERRLRKSVKQVQEAATKWKQVVLEYGGQPIQEMNPEALTHKYHYFSLLRRLKEPYCYQGVQATSQIELSVSREELLGLFNWAHLLTPIFQHVSANSPILGGKDSYRSSARMWHQSKLEVGDGRWQMIETPYSGIDEWVFHLFYQPHLLCKDPEGWLDPAEGLFGQHAKGKTGIEVWDDFLDHVDTLWTGAQPKLRSGTLQFAEVEQCGIAKTLGLMALSLGVAENKDKIFDWLEDLVPDPPAKREFGLWPHQILQRNLDYQKDLWKPLHQLWTEQIRRDQKEEPFSGLWDGIFCLAEEGLIKRGLGEERYLQTIRKIEDQSTELRRAWILGGAEELIERVRMLDMEEH